MRDRRHGLQLSSPPRYRWLRWIFYIALLLVILTFGGGKDVFIYFQF